MNTSIWATEKDSFDIGCRVVKWDEPGGLNLVKFGKYSDTKINNLAELQKKLTQFTIHWSVSYTAKSTYTGISARNLSCNFIIDDNEIQEDSEMQPCATIYQCLPINKLGWSQGSDEKGRSFNTLGPGLELALMPQAWEKNMYTPELCKKYGVQPHETTMAKVHGSNMKIYLPTESQMRSISSLIWGYSQLFPDIPMKFPRGQDGKILTTQMKMPYDWKGLCSHLHLTTRKIDTAGFDLERIERDVEEMKSCGYNMYRAM